MIAKFPSVSVILPFRNAEKTLSLAIKSILHQTIGNLELILIDDFSTDNSLAIAKSFFDPRIKLICNPSNLGLPNSLNIGLNAASSDFIARMDADDISYPKRLEIQINYLKKHPEIDIVGSAIIVFKNERTPTRILVPVLKVEEIRKGGLMGAYQLYHPTWVGRKHWFVGNLYDSSFLKAQDFELLLRGFKKNNYANVPEILLGYREAEETRAKRLMTRRYVFYAQVKNYLKRGCLVNFMIASLVTLIKYINDLFFGSRWFRVRDIQHLENNKIEIARWYEIFEKVSL
jgi:glycosyltransferase involved in cell wall biosynthesis